MPVTVTAPSTQPPPSCIPMTTNVTPPTRPDRILDRTLSDPRSHRRQDNPQSSNISHKRLDISAGQGGVEDPRVSDSISSTSSAIASSKRRANRSNTISATPKSPTRPVFHTRPEPRNLDVSPTREESSAPFATSLLPKLTVNSPNEGRPAQLKRSPASHSSHGVETSNGPPPSFSTQKTLSQDRLWKPTLSDALDLQIDLSPQSKRSPQRMPNDSIVKDQGDIQPGVSNEISDLSEQEQQSMELREGESDSVEPREEKDQSQRALDSSTEEGNQSSSGSREDLFLNIAKAEEDRNAQTRTERRRVSFAISQTPVLTSLARVALDVEIFR